MVLLRITDLINPKDVGSLTLSMSLCLCLSTAPIH